MWIRSLFGYVLMALGLYGVGFCNTLFIMGMTGRYDGAMASVVMRLVLSLLVVFLAWVILRSRQSETELLAVAETVAAGVDHVEEDLELDDVTKGYRELMLRELFGIRDAVDADNYRERLKAVEMEIARRARSQSVNG